MAVNNGRTQFMIGLITTASGRVRPATLADLEARCDMSASPERSRGHLEDMGFVFPRVLSDGRLEVVQPAAREAQDFARGALELRVCEAVARGDHLRARCAPKLSSPADIPIEFRVDFGPSPLEAAYHETVLWQRLRAALAPYGSGE